MRLSICLFAAAFSVAFANSNDSDKSACNGPCNGETDNAAFFRIIAPFDLKKLFNMDLAETVGNLFSSDFPSLSTQESKIEDGVSERDAPPPAISLSSVFDFFSRNALTGPRIHLSVTSHNGLVHEHREELDGQGRVINSNDETYRQPMDMYPWSSSWVPSLFSGPFNDVALDSDLEMDKNLPLVADLSQAEDMASLQESRQSSPKGPYIYVTSVQTPNVLCSDKQEWNEWLECFAMFPPVLLIIFLALCFVAIVLWCLVVSVRNAKRQALKQKNLQSALTGLGLNGNADGSSEKLVLAKDIEAGDCGKLATEVATFGIVLDNPPAYDDLSLYSNDRDSLPPFHVAIIKGTDVPNVDKK